MKLKFFLVLTALVLCFTLAACDKDKNDTLENDNVEATESGSTSEDTQNLETADIPSDSVDTEPAETEHVHEFNLSNTVDGNCVDEGYEVYSCRCGSWYRNLIPSAHKYSEQKDTTGKYIRKLCELCGDYKIVRDQTYLHNITFEGFKDAKDAANAQKNLSFYGSSPADGTNGKIEIKTDLDGSYMYIYDCNYYIQDITNTMIKNKFVVSIDIKFEKFTDLELISFAHQKTDGGFNYNSGVVKITSDGKVRFHGESQASDVVLNAKGYNNFTVVCNPITAICDVYINEKLVKSGIKYVSVPSNVKNVYIRYFDRKAGFAAAADNIKMYVAATPEFIVPNGITFAN